MRRSSLVIWGLPAVGGTISLAALLSMPVQGPFTEADCERVVTLGTLEEIVANFRPPIPDAESGLFPRAEIRPNFWKAWRGGVNDMHVQFDSREQALLAL